MAVRDTVALAPQLHTTSHVRSPTQVINFFRSASKFQQNMSIAGNSRLSSVMILQPDQFVLLTNLFFKINILLPDN